MIAFDRFKYEREAHVRGVHVSAESDSRLSTFDELMPVYIMSERVHMLLKIRNLLRCH